MSKYRVYWKKPGDTAEEQRTPPKPLTVANAMAENLRAMGNEVRIVKEGE